MTDLQQAVLDYIHAYVEARSENPQTSEVVRHFRSRREAAVARALEGLGAAGHIALVNGRWRPKAPPQLHLLSVEETGTRPR